MPPTIDDSMQWTFGSDFAALASAPFGYEVLLRSFHVLPHGVQSLLGISDIVQLCLLSLNLVGQHSQLVLLGIDGLLKDVDLIFHLCNALTALQKIHVLLVIRARQLLDLRSEFDVGRNIHFGYQTHSKGAPFGKHGTCLDLPC